MNNPQRVHAMRLSLIDGAFASVMSAFTGGVFLTGFAVQVLQVHPTQIGLLAALPTLASLAQFLGSYLIETVVKRKALSVFCVVLGRILWLGLILLPLPLVAAIAPWRHWLLITLMATTNLLGYLGHAGWLSWMSDLVPETTRGAYFGKRNMIIAICGVGATLVGGLFLSFWNQRVSANNPYGFVCIFAVGGLAGLISARLLSRMPDLDDLSTVRVPFRFTAFRQPFSEPNFRRLMWVVAGWTFATQLAAPFYTVFMIKHLHLSYMTMTIFTTLATLAMAFMMQTWGPLADKFGNKPVLVVSSLVLVFVPAIWLFAQPQAYRLALALAHSISGAALAGATLSQFNISMKLSPHMGRSVYLAAFTAVVGLIGGLAPIIGGYLSESLQELRITIGDYEITRFHAIFLLSAALQILILPGYIKLTEEGAASPVAVIVQLQNDLNPQSGISSALDIAMIEFERAGDMLEDLDAITDAWAERSERKVARVLDTLSQPLKKIRDALRRDD